MAVGSIYNDGVYRYTVLTESGNTGTVSIGAYTTESVVGNVTLPEKFITGSMVYDVTKIETGVVNNQFIAGFTNCKYLTGVTIPNSLQIYSSNGAFGYSSISYINFSSNIQYIDTNYLNKTNLKKVIIPNKIHSLYNQCFTNCTSLKEVYIPNSVNNISTRAFSNSSNLKRLYIGNGVETINTSSFWNTPKLEEVYVDSQNIVDHFAEIFPQITSSDAPLRYVHIGDSVTSIGENAFLSGSSLREVHLGKNVQRIGNYAFNRCANLHYINIPESVQSIGASAFATNLKIYNLNIPKNANIGGSSFAVTNPLYINHNGSNLSNQAFYYNYYSSYNYRCKLNITSNTVNVIGNNCFQSSYKLFDLRFPASIKEIKSNAFYAIYHNSGEKDLHSITFEGNCPITASAIFNDTYDPNLKIYYYENTEGWTSTFGNMNIPTQQVFRGDYESNNLLYRFVDGHDHTPNVSVRVKPGVKLSGAVTIPQTIAIKGVTYTVRYIAEEGFAEQYNITSIDLHNQFIEIGKNGFRNCSKLTTVSNTNHLMYIYEGAFDGCSELTSFNIYQDVLYLFKNTFRNCENLKTLTLSPNIRAIEDDCFLNCKSLTSVEISDVTTNIGKNCFANCISLTSVTYGTALEEIPESAFSNCKSLTTFTASSTNNLKRIRDKAFYNCYKLTTPPISAATQIGEYCFYNNRSLTSLTLPSTIDYIKDYAFANCVNLETLTNNTTNIADFGNNVFLNCKVSL